VIRVDRKRLAAWRKLLHLPLQPERDSAVALALYVITWNSTPSLRSCFLRVFQKAQRTGQPGVTGRTPRLHRAISVKRFTAVFGLEGDGAIVPRNRCRRVDHQRSNVFRTILGSLCDGNAAHAVAG